LLTVDVGGLPVDYSSFDLPVISDSAESMGAEYHGELVGGQCDIHTFSFQRAKIITTGEGGAVTTNNPHLYEIMRSICNHGYSPQKEEWQYRHNRFGLNFRMTELEAAVGLAQFKKLDKYVKERRAKAKIYKDIVGDLARYQQEPADRRSSHFFFGILVSHDTNQFCMEMLKRGIQTKTWTPVHQQTPYSRMCGNWKNANWVSQRIVLLPIHNKLSQDETIFVAETAKNILKGKQ
jgi:perosamine synthetase